jgi:outer membrane lipoprotein-sorting protein
MYKLLLLAIFISIGAQAQYAGYKPVPDATTFKKQFGEASRNIRSLRSDFVQEKNLSMLSEKIVSKGKFWFKRDNLVRMEYDKPYKYLVVINKSNVFIKDEQKENRISSRSNRTFQQVNRIIVDCVQGSALDNPDFTTKLFEGKDSWLVELTPKEKGLKELFKNINIIVDKKELGILRMDMVEQTGDNTLISFPNKELNIDIPDALFAIK